MKLKEKELKKLNDKKNSELEKIRKANQITREKERIKKERQANKNIRINKRLEKKLTKQISKKPENIHIKYKELADVRVELSKSIKIIGKRKESYDLRQLAIKDYNEALKLKPDYKEAYINRGIAKKYIFDLSGACDDWVQAFSYENN